MLVFGCVGSIRSYAENYNYEIAGAEMMDLTDTDRPAVFGTWIGAEDKTNYNVKLYKGEKCLSSRVVKGTEIDFSSSIILKAGGTGKYHFTVTTTKGNHKIESDELEVTSRMVSLMRSRITKERKAARAATGGGWEKGPGDIWIYYDTNGEQVKNRWCEINGYRYYFDNAGIMQTGWHLLSGKHYYLEPKGSAEHPLGSMWRSATTPDGHQVDASGARIGDMATAPKARESALSAVSFYLKEQQAPGTYSRLLDVTCSAGTVTNVSYSSDPATWTNKTAGVVTFDVKLSGGKVPTANMKLNCSRASGIKLLQKTVDSLRVELHYIPRYMLKAPDNFMINTEDRIFWEKVANAESYKVTVTAVETDSDGNSSNKTKSYTVSTPGFTLSDHDYFDEQSIVSMHVQAVGANKKITANSVTVRLESIADLRADHTVEGEFTRTGRGLKYVDEASELAYGWKEIAGYWYYFRATGYAAGPGWYQEKDKNWYYFDEYNRMVTGSITEDGKTYFLNDGSNTSLPLGALIE